MGGNTTKAPQEKKPSFSDQIGVKAARKLKGLRGHHPGVWFGLGIPTFLGASLGVWWDRRHPGGHSWTLALLAAGLVVGCVNAWHWMTWEDKAMHDDPEAHDE
jgi:ATP synthase protein I